MYIVLKVKLSLINLQRYTKSSTPPCIPAKTLDNGCDNSEKYCIFAVEKLH